MHFYSECKGNRTAATRAGTEASGVSAYVQSRTVRIATRMMHDDQTGQDFGFVTLHAGPSAEPTNVYLTGDINPAAIVQAAGWDPETMRHLRQARASIQRANAAAVKACARRDKLSRKAA